MSIIERDISYSKVLITVSLTIFIILICVIVGSYILSNPANSVFSDNKDKRLLNSFIKKYNNLEEYTVEYSVYIASEEKSYFGSDDDGHNTKSGGYFIQKTYKKDNDFKTYNDGSGTEAHKVFFTFNRILVNNLEELFLNNQHTSCGDGTCKENNQHDFFEWDWKFFQNPNFFYNYLINNDYTVQSLGEGTSIAFNEKIARAYYHEDDVKRKYYSAEELIKLGKKCELFKIILDEKIHIENIGFIDKNKLRKAEVDICIDKDTGVIVELSIFAQSDAKSEDEEKLHNIISWHARIGTTTASNDDIMQKGKYTFVGKAWNENEAVVVIEPYISNYMSGSAEFLNRDNTILKKIDLHWQIFIGQEKKKLIIKHDLNLEKEIKYRLCIDDYCKVIGPSIISKNYNCFKNSLDKASCEKNSDCFYDDDLCLKFECNSLLIKDKEFCESRGCHWLVREDVSDRCIAYSCRLYKNEYSCNSESEDCAWSDFGCVDKECSVYNNKDACETSSLKCVWKGFGCRDFYCSSQNNKTECHNHEECIWKLTEIKTAGDCKNKNEIDYATLPNCPYLEETDCLKEDLCLWRQNKCFFNLCGIYTNAECEENENCYWEPHGSCIYNYKNEIDN